MNATKDYKREIEKVTDEAKIRELLKILLPKLGFCNVIITHGKDEKGKDLVFSSVSQLGTYDWFAMVVKKGKIIGSSDTDNNAIINIRNQIELCFEHPYYFPKENRTYYINKVIVVSGGTISANAEEQIVHKLKEKANIAFWTSNTLADYVEKHIPEFFSNIDIQTSNYYTRLQAEFDKLNELKSFHYSKELKALFEVFIEPKLLVRRPKEIKSKDKIEAPIEFEFRSVNSILETQGNAFVIGEPGSGKSTLLRKLVLQLIHDRRAKREYDKIPVLIKFRDVIVNKSIFEVTKSNLLVFFPDEELFNLDAKLTKGDIILFIDGFDEISNSDGQEDTIKLLQDFTTKYPKVKVVATSRNTEFIRKREQIADIRKMELLPLNYHQIQSFVGKWFSKDEAKKTRLLNSLRDTDIMNKLPKTPLVLTLLAILFDENESEVPSNLTELYSMFTELFLGRWDAERKIETSYKYELKDRLLRSLAKKLHVDHFEEITPIEINSFVQKQFDERGYTLDVGSFLEEIETRSQLLIRNPRGNYQFKHLSFQEYFFSRELSETHAPQDFVWEKFLDLWWQEVIFFYCGRMKECPDILKKIIKEVPHGDLTQQFRKTMALGQLLQASYANLTIDKVECIRHGLELMIEIYHNFLKMENLPSMLKKASRYYIIELLSFFFEIYYGSITLSSAMEELFEKLAYDVIDNKVESVKEVPLQLFFLSKNLSMLGKNEPLINLADIISTDDMSLNYALEVKLKSIKSDENSKEFTKALSKIRKRTRKWEKELKKELSEPMVKKKTTKGV